MTEVLRNKDFKIEPFNLEYFDVPKGNIIGDFDDIFLIDFNTTQSGYTQIFEHDGKSYTWLQSMGMVGNYIDNQTFKATFYNCFGDVLFEEDTFHLIHEEEPKISDNV